MVTGLNPCFSGIYRDPNQTKIHFEINISLNPCFSGIYRDTISFVNEIGCEYVLILVLVEYTVTRPKMTRNLTQCSGLNPCFSGIYRDS